MFFFSVFYIFSSVHCHFCVLADKLYFSSTFWLLFWRTLVTLAHFPAATFRLFSRSFSASRWASHSVPSNTSQPTWPSLKTVKQKDGRESQLMGLFNPKNYFLVKLWQPLSGCKCWSARWEWPSKPNGQSTLLENPSVWLIWNISAKHRGSEILHSDVED